LKADRRDVLKLGALAWALPALPAFAVSAPAAATVCAVVAEVWGMSFWTADAGGASVTPAAATRSTALHPPEWHPEFA